MLQGLPIVLAQVKTGNTSENLLTEIRQIIYFLYRAKEITKKSMQQYNEFNKMEIIFRNSGNSPTSDPHRLSLSLSDEVNLKRNDKYAALSEFSIYYTWNNKSEISAPT